MHPECEQKDNQKGILTQCIFLWNAIYVSLNQLVKSAAKDRRRPVMRERVSQAVSHPTAHKGQCPAGGFNDSHVCWGIGEQVRYPALRGHLERKTNVMLSPSLMWFYNPCVLGFGSCRAVPSCEGRSHARGTQLPVPSGGNYLVRFASRPAIRLTSPDRRSLNKYCGV